MPLYRLYFALSLALFISCNNDDTISMKQTDNLFIAAEDTVLFNNQQIATTTLSADSAFKISNVVIAGRLLYIDSTIHGSEHAHFYLVTVTVDTVLKGIIPKAPKVFFAANEWPLLPGNDTVMIYLSMLDKKRKLLTDGLRWQWTENAPVILYTKPAIDTTVIEPHLSGKHRRLKRHKTNG